MILLVKSVGEIVDGRVAKLQGDLTDGVFVLPEHLTALFQFCIADKFFGRLIHCIFKQDLQRGAG